MSKPVAVEKENNERWIISYADLVTLLLGFFIIMYATSQQDVELFHRVAASIQRAFNVEVKAGVGDTSPVFDGGSGIFPDPYQPSPISRDLELIRQSVQQHAEATGVDPGQIVVLPEPDRIVIRLADNLLFPSASAVIRPAARPLLDVVGAVIADLPNQIQIEGHTDNVPVGTDRYPTNWELSSARATAALRYLVEEAGLDGRRMFAAGYGEFQPVASNLTPEGRALNRRADIVVLYEPVADSERDVGPVLGDE